MDKISEEFLKEYIHSHVMGFNNDYDFVSLFKMYASFEVHSFDELISAPNKYADFLNKNIKIIKHSPEIMSYRLPNLIEIAREKLLAKIKSSMSKAQEDYVNIVSTLAPNKNNSHILDVGAGSIPYTAILFGERFKHASTMDREFFLNNDTLNNLNVTGIPRFFTQNTPVENFDIVVGKAPCTAIEHIVRNCAAAGKPYFIELCDCALPNKHLHIAEWYGWKNILPGIDEYVKFYTTQVTYAFNLGDVTVDQAKKVIDKYDKPWQEPDSNLNLGILVDNTSNTDWHTSKDANEKNDLNDYHTFEEDLKMELFER